MLCVLIHIGGIGVGIIIRLNYAVFKVICLFILLLADLHMIRLDLDVAKSKIVL